MKKSKFYSFIIHFVVLLPAFALTALLISCNGDTGTGPSTGGPPQTNDSLIFQKDSIVFRSNINQMFSNVYLLSYQDSLKFEFQGLTNFDSSKAYFDIGIFTYNDSNYNVGAYSVYLTWSFWDFNRYHIYYSQGYYDPLFMHIRCSIFNSFSNESKHIVLKNVKVFKIKN